MNPHGSPSVGRSLFNDKIRPSLLFDFVKIFNMLNSEMMQSMHAMSEIRTIKQNKLQYNKFLDYPNNLFCELLYYCLGKKWEKCQQRLIVDRKDVTTRIWTCWLQQIGSREWDNLRNHLASDQRGSTTGCDSSEVHKLMYTLMLSVSTRDQSYILQSITVLQSKWGKWLRRKTLLVFLEVELRQLDFTDICWSEE